jgi:hypothetical protein
MRTISCFGDDTSVQTTQSEMPTKIIVKVVLPVCLSKGIAPSDKHFTIDSVIGQSPELARAGTHCHRVS